MDHHDSPRDLSPSVDSHCCRRGVLARRTATETAGCGRRYVRNMMGLYGDMMGYLLVSIYRSIYRSIHPSIYRSIDLSLFLPFFLPLASFSHYQTNYLFVCLSVYLSIYLSNLVIEPGNGTCTFSIGEQQVTGLCASSAPFGLQVSHPFLLSMDGCWALETHRKTVCSQLRYVFIVIYYDLAIYYRIY